jgi:hypothetical protein
MAVFSDIAVSLESREPDEGPAARRGLAGVAHLRARWRLSADRVHAPPRPAGRRLREAA